MTRLLIAESQGFSTEALRILRTTFDVEAADLGRVALLRDVAAYDVLWVRLRHQIDAEVFAAASRLQAIVTNTTGLNHIDQQAAAEHGVAVLSLRGETEFLRDVRATAEHTLALMLALLRRLPQAVKHVNGGGWQRDLFCGGELQGRTVGIIGYGRIGRLVASYLQAFGAAVIATTVAGVEDAKSDGVPLVPLEDLLSSSDLVSIHADLNEGSFGLLGPDQFDQMRPGAYLINTARGELIDEPALLAALESGHLAGAALDVLVVEHQLPAAARPLIAYARQHANLLITPHIGGRTTESAEKTEIFMARKLNDWFADKQPTRPTEEPAPTTCGSSHNH